MTREYKGVSKFIDRHDKLRWRAQAKGRKAAMLPGLYGSEDFIKAWAAWRDGKPREIGVERTLPGSIGAFIIGYLPALKKNEELAESTRAQYRAALERFREKNGDKSRSSLTQKTIAALLEGMEIEPSNMLLRALRNLCKHGVKKDLLKSDPTFGIEKRRPRRESDGFHTWTVGETDQFGRHTFRTPGLTAKAQLALNLLLCCASRKSDVVQLGPQHEIDDGASLRYRHKKTGNWSVLPVLEPLREAIDAVPRQGLTYLLTDYGLPFSDKGFGNWFRDRCDEAGLPHCTSHGLRKAAGTRLADAGRSEHEIAAVLACSLATARIYTKAANQRKLAAQAAGAIVGSKSEQNSSKPLTRFAKFEAKSLKRNGVK